jgi:glycine oxidase
LYRHGFLIAPAMLDVVMELLTTGDSELARSFDLRVEHLPTEHAQHALRA